MWWILLGLQVGFFVILVLTLQKLYHGNLSSAVSRVQGLQQQNLRKEHELKLREEKLRRECEEKTRALDEEVAKRREMAEEEMKNTRDSILYRTEQERQVILAQVLEKERSLERRFAQETKHQGELAACRIVEKAFNARMKEMLHRELVGELLEALDGLDASKIELRGGAVKVRSAYPLAVRERELLMEKVASALNLKKPMPALNEETDASLVAGFILTLDRTELDGSLANRFRKLLKDAP